MEQPVGMALMTAQARQQSAKLIEVFPARELNLFKGSFLQCRIHTNKVGPAARKTQQNLWSLVSAQKITPGKAFGVPNTIDEFTRIFTNRFLVLYASGCSIE